MYIFYIICPDHSVSRLFRNSGEISFNQEWEGLLNKASECQMMIPGTFEEEK